MWILCGYVYINVDNLCKAACMPVDSPVGNFYKHFSGMGYIRVYLCAYGGDENECAVCG